MKKTLPLTLLAATALLAAPIHAIAADGKALATVNGKPITKTQYDLYLKSRQGGNAEIPADMLLQELINRELIYRDALKRKLDKDAEYTEAMQNQQMNMLAAFTLTKEVKALGDVSDAMLKKEYDQVIGTMSKDEYQARHILVKSEKEAREIIEKLDKKTDFATLAKEKSTDPGSSEEGGSLGWFRAEQMVKPFADSLKSLKPGQYTKAPVQTQFGWHVILLEEVRKANPPAFETIKDQLRNSIVNKRVQEYIKGLRDKADIKISAQH